MRFLITRPEPDASDLARRLEAIGQTGLIDPLMRVVYEPARPIDATGLTAVVVTSRNGLRAVETHPDLPSLLQLPVYVVGPATAALARALGFARVVEGAGTAAALAPLVAASVGRGGLVLHLTGAAQAFDMTAALRAHGIGVRSHVGYRTEPADALRTATVEALTSGAVDGVILLSERTAQAYVALMRHHQLEPVGRRLRHYVLAAPIAEVLEAWRASRIVRPLAPRLDELLAQIARDAAQSSC